MMYPLLTVRGSPLPSLFGPSLPFNTYTLQCCEEKWDNSPRVVSRIADAIQLADRIYQRMKADFKLKGGNDPTRQRQFLPDPARSHGKQR
jgi:hypothetical protein